jgi:hypothetical protein
MSPNSDSHESGQSAESGGNLKIIDLEFETLRQFRQVMAPRLNYEGFFVATDDPLPKGTPARFRFLLPDGFVLVEGTAVVAWARFEDAGPEEKAGMALLFNELENQSREIVDELIDFHIATGGDPFDMGPSPSEPGDIGTDALMGESGEERLPAPETEPVPQTTEPGEKKSEEFLPDWLSEVAQRHDVDLTGDVTVPVNGVPEVPETPVSDIPVQEDFGVSLIPEVETPDETPFETDVGAQAEVTLPVSEAHKPPRDLRLWPFLAAAGVIVAGSVIVWWIVNRAPSEDFSQPAVVFEETPVPVPTPEGVEQTGPEPTAVPSEVSPIEHGAVGGGTESGPATRVLLVAATRAADATIVTVKTNGELSEDAVRVTRLKDPARVWVRIQGIETFYRPNDIEVGTPEVERLRVGHHPEETPQSIYVVFDLANPTAAVLEHTVDGDTLRVVVGRQ